jgi:hypothetical protein
LPGETTHEQGKRPGAKAPCVFGLVRRAEALRSHRKANTPAEVKADPFRDVGVVVWFLWEKGECTDGNGRSEDNSRSPVGMTNKKSKDNGNRNNNGNGNSNSRSLRDDKQKSKDNG